MEAIEKTKNHKRVFVPIGSLEANPDNPNEMSEDEFNMLYDNVERVGITDPIFVVPHPENEDGYRIIGGEHRWEVAKLLGFEEVPVTIVEDEDFTVDEQKFQMVRHNIIHGKMSPKKFMDLYSSLQDEYSQEVAAEMFGFTDAEEFQKLIAATKKELPKEFHEDFDAAKGELKTIDDLANLLNGLFSKHGDTLPYGYMIFDFGGKESVWLRLPTSDLNMMKGIGAICMEANCSMDSLVMSMMQHVMGDKELMSDLAAESDKVDLSNLAEDTLPTLDFLDA